MGSVLDREKTRVRQAVLEKLSRLDSGTVLAKSRSVCERLLCTTWWQEAEVVLAYVSMPAEVQTAALIRQALEEHKAIGAPRIEGSDLKFYCFTKLDAGFIRNRYGIEEPDPTARHLNSPVELSVKGPRVLIVTPGVAFDREKNRLGRGGGYYDRFFCALKHSGNRFFAVGACFQTQLLSALPHTDRDQPVDAIITETRTIS